MIAKHAAVSPRLLETLRLERERGVKQYAIARAARLHPSTVSCLVNSIVPIREHDARVIRLGAALGLRPEECFVELEEISA